MSDAARPPALALNAWLRWDLARREIRRLAPASILEIGCGQGAVGARLATHHDYRAYEPDPHSWAAAARRVGRAGDVIHDVAPDHPDRTFDLVCAFEVLEHIEDDTAALAAWTRWAAPGGALMISVPGRPHRFGPADHAVGHFRRYTREDLEQRLVDAGLADVRVLVYGFPLGYALEAARNILARVSPPDGPDGPDGPDDDRAARTAASGRWRPPADSLAWLTRLASGPFRLAQRPFVESGPGTGLMGIGRRPA